MTLNPSIVKVYVTPITRFLLLYFNILDGLRLVGRKGGSKERKEGRKENGGKEGQKKFRKLTQTTVVFLLLTVFIRL